MSAANPTLKDSIQKAFDEQKGIEGAPVQEEENEEQVEGKEGEEEKPKEKPQEKPKKEEKKEAEEEDTVEDAEIQEAVEFYRALRDPAQQKEIIRDLASRMGILQPEQKMEPKDEKTLNTLLEEVLAEEYPDLKPKLTQIFGKIQKDNDEKIESLRREISQDKAEQARTRFESEFGTFLTTNKVDDSVASAMLKEMEILPPPVGGKSKITLTQYLSKIHKLATVDHKTNTQALQKNERRESNRKETPGNLSSEVDESRIKRGSKLPSLRESINAAADGITFED